MVVWDASMKQKYIVNQKTFDQSFARLKDFNPVEDYKLAKAWLTGQAAYLAGETKDALIYIGEAGDNQIIHVVKMNEEQATSLAYGPIIKPLGYNNTKIPQKTHGGKMTDDKLAKYLLNKDIDPQFIWIYEHIEETGIVYEQTKCDIDLKANLKGFKTRWLKENTIRTSDFRFDRIEIHLTNDNKIRSINIG